MEKKWIVAGWLDITAFRSWTRRASISSEVKDKFTLEFYGLLQDYVREHHGSWSKYEGDALISIREFTQAQKEDRRSIFNFIIEMRSLYRKVKFLIEHTEDGPPGVRIRWIAGQVSKLMVLDPNDAKKGANIPEYVGYCINTLKGLLEMNPEIPCLATNNVVKPLGTKASIFLVRPLDRPSCSPKGVDKEDIDGLKILKF